MLSEKYQEELVNASIGLMQIVSEIYGAERVQELWTTIADTIDPELKDAVFMAMLTGNYRRNRLHVRNPFVSDVANKVAVVKCIRTYDNRRLTLKEAVEIADRLNNAGVQILEVDPKIRPTFAVELRKLGLVAN
jgi:hypothetical protein